MKGNTLRHGISNPASGGLKSQPSTGKEVADNKREAFIDWIASANNEMENFNRLEGLKEATPQERSSSGGKYSHARWCLSRKF
eukprot:12929958-Prorocentrum_lima.AAC.1